MAESIWLSTLSEVQYQTSIKLSPGKFLLIIGDECSGKSALISKVKRSDVPEVNGCGLEYQSVSIGDEYSENMTQLGIWILDGNGFDLGLLKIALNQRTFSDCTIVLTTSMEEPWNIMESLQRWLLILQTHVFGLKLNDEEMDKCQERVLSRFRFYVDPAEEYPKLKRTPQTLDDDTLISNIGLDIIIVITKTDYMAKLKEEFQLTEPIFDFIQQSIRTLCLKYGASLFYTSAKQEKQNSLLYRYLLHRIYNFRFLESANFFDQDAVFVPAGSDSTQKISLLYKSDMKSIWPTCYYSDVVPRPKYCKSSPKEPVPTIFAEEDQSFLRRMEKLMNEPLKQQDIHRQTPVSVRSNRRDRHRNDASKMTTPTTPNLPASSGVLSHFFTSLLTRKGSTASPGAPCTPDMTNTTNILRSALYASNDSEDSFDQALNAQFSANSEDLSFDVPSGNTVTTVIIPEENED